MSWTTLLADKLNVSILGWGGPGAAHEHVFRSYDEEHKVVSVVLQGACSGCPSSTATLKSGIENLLKEMLPNMINEVIAING